MKNVLQIELNKAIKTRYFAISIIIGTMIGIVGLVYNVNLVYNSQIYDGINPCYEGFTLFNHWIGGEGFSLGSSLYFFVFPLLIALPYGWSFCGERNSGYMRQMLVRAGEKSYLTAKFLATFIAGGLAMVVPLIINFMLTALFIPAITPVPTYDTMYGVFGNSLFSSLYYTQPFAYVAVYMLVDFMFCGALACITMLSAQFIKYKWVNCIFPFVVCMVLNVLNNMLFSNTPGAENYQFSPFYFTKCVQTGYPAKLWIIVLMSMLMAAITIAVNMVLMHKKDVM